MIQPKIPQYQTSIRLLTNTQNFNTVILSKMKNECILEHQQTTATENNPADLLVVPFKTPLVPGSDLGQDHCMSQRLNKVLTSSSTNTQ